VIEKYVELYLKVPFVIAFIEKEMVKRGMDVNVGVHVFNSMWSNKEKKSTQRTHTEHLGRCSGLATTAATCTTPSSLKLRQTLWMYCVLVCLWVNRFFFVLADGTS
jgi:hypothetical protein